MTNSATDLAVGAFTNDGPWIVEPDHCRGGAASTGSGSAPRPTAIRHGERIASEVGIDPREREIDLDGMKASMGLTGDVEGITHRELQERRQLIRKRMQEREKKGRR